MGNTILQFTVSGTNGLTAMTPATVAAAASFAPIFVVPDLSGRFVYAINTAGMMQPFTMDASTGALTAGTAFTPSGNPLTGAYQFQTTTDGNHVIVETLTGFTVYSVSAAGAWTQVGSTTAFPVSTNFAFEVPLADTIVWQFTMPTPPGGCITPFNAPLPVSPFSFNNTSGALGAVTPHSLPNVVFGCGGFPSFAMDFVNGAFAWAWTGSPPPATPSITAYTLNSTSGAITQQAAITTGPGGTVFPEPSFDDKFVMLEQTDNSGVLYLQSTLVNSSTGVLTAAGNDIVYTSGAGTLKFTQNGTVVLVAMGGTLSSTLYSYTLDATGVLTPVTTLSGLPPYAFVGEVAYGARLPQSRGAVTGGWSRGHLLAQP